MTVARSRAAPAGAASTEQYKSRIPSPLYLIWAVPSFASDFFLHDADPGWHSSFRPLCVQYCTVHDSYSIFSAHTPSEVHVYCAGVIYGYPLVILCDIIQTVI
jgi:hypothetical protein